MSLFNDNFEQDASTAVCVNDYVRVKALAGTDDSMGRVTCVVDGRYHVSSMNMPFCGSISQFFTADEIEKV